MKVLFVEDSLSARNIMKRMLSHYFDDIDIAKDGQEAIDKYHQYYDENHYFYDIVFTDLEMPIMDGKELSKLIIDFNSLQEIVVLSGINDFKLIINLINVGIKKFISKPVDPMELETVILEVVTSIRNRQLKENEKLEVEEHNRHLKQREKENKAILEAKVKELEEFSHALDTSAIVMKTNREGVITYVNEEFCNVSGYTEDELIGKNNNLLRNSKRSSSFYKKLWNTITNKKSYKTLFENIAKDGSSYYVETVINPILDIKGEIVEFIAVSHDMTQLMNSLETAKNAQKSKEEFFINISHEMKTPLNSILGFSSLLQKRLKDDEKASLMLNTIQETGNDLKNLIESIIDMRKIQDRSFVLKELMFNPKIEIQRCLNKFMNKAYEKEQEYISNVEETLPESLLGDIVRINQVIGIVIDNAIKFTPNAGKVSVHISFDRYTKTILCEIKDNGIGIAKENQKKIFGMEQLDSASNRSYEGSGIGLNIALHIVTMMKGKISLKSIPKRGSLFSIEFPVECLYNT